MVILIEVNEVKSDADNPNCNSGCALYELKFTNDVPDLIIAAPPSLAKFEDVTGLSPFEKTFLTSFMVVLSSNLIVKFPQVLLLQYLKY